ncbi:hypothetical protein ASF53_05325 [Methylobacterium sp. Leaf123]|nr:hypothetical protein ASF53_05325 [Methylobacterium sp. Leaf123]
MIDTPQQAMDYLIFRAILPQSPFVRGQWVNIIDRSSLPANIGWYEVGVVVECPNEPPVCWVLVLTGGGDAVVVAIPKAHLAPR